MDPFTMVFLIVLVVFGSLVARAYLRDRQRYAESSVDEGLRNELEGLKKRVAVLEEIVTDGKYQLNRELQRLENEPPGAA